MGGVAQPRRLAVLALLARAGPAGVPRDRLLATLWPDTDEERARHTFNQALYAIRRDLGDDDVITGVRELRLDPERLPVDAVDFETALAQRSLQRGAELYGGAFLDGFHLPGADEFERWVSSERTLLERAFVGALEQLARDAAARGDHATAVEWWRKRAAYDPLDARIAVALMQSLDAAGDRRGAIKHARVYELLIDEELSLPPDREVVQLAERLRREPAAAAGVAVAEPAPAAVAKLPAAAPVLTPVTAASAEAASALELPASSPVPAVDIVRHRDRRPGGRRAMLAGGMLLGLAAVSAVAIAVARRGDGADAAPVIAVGRISDYRRGESAPIAGSLTDLLATNLSRASGVRVISSSRMYELLRPLGGTRDTTSGALAMVARQAGAHQLLDGALYDHAGRLRLDLRRVDLATGSVRAAYSVEASDLFSLADSGTAQVIAGLGSSAPRGSVADVTTRSAAAYRMYEEGLRAHFRGERDVARGFFEAALGEDSLFALAQYYAGIDAVDDVSARRHIERARQLAGRAADRERLTILAGWAFKMSSPTLRAVAETLVTRYPTEVASHLSLGLALAMEGSYLQAIGPLERVVAMDSLALRGAAPDCQACDAFAAIVSAYAHADSLAAAERTARRWLRLQPQSRHAVQVLTDILDAQGRGVEADSGLHAFGPNDAFIRRAFFLIRAGDYGAADRLLADLVGTGGVFQQIDGYWTLAISLRQQGRLAEALEVTRRLRRINPPAATAVPGGAPSVAVLEAQTLLELGRSAAAAALYDSIARGRDPLDIGSAAARRSAWHFTHAADARAAAGDTASLARLADSVQSFGASSGLGRDHRLHHHVRGLLLAARNDDEGAVAQFRQAMISRNFGYTRTNYELGRALLRLRRPTDAIAVLQPALRGSIEGSNLYVTRTELHELLAQAWDQAGGRDSAAAHYRAVASSWKRADPMFRGRRAHAEARLAAVN